jgi:pimeloyl-ACP methyl ester carboxylesterase
MPDMQTKFVEANGLRFEVLQEGTGDRLALCLHGFPEHAISWRHQIPMLAGMGYRVWAVNQRGYGRTTRPTHVADYALPHLVDDVTALINAASAKNVVLIGHDWGAMVAWCFAAQQRRPLDRLVIMNDPHPLCFRAALKPRRARCREDQRRSPRRRACGAAALARRRPSLEQHLSLSASRFHSHPIVSSRSKIRLLGL